MEAEELTASLGKRIGIDLALDADGSCAFEADGLVVVLDYVPETGSIVLAGEIGEPPPERLEGLYKTLLAANHLFSGTGGATLSLDGDRIMVCRSLPTAIMDGDSFYAEVEKFVNTAETWRKIVVDYRDAAALTPAADAAESPSFPSGGFMQV